MCSLPATSLCRLWQKCFCLVWRKFFQLKTFTAPTKSVRVDWICVFCKMCEIGKMNLNYVCFFSFSQGMNRVLNELRLGLAKRVRILSLATGRKKRRQQNRWHSRFGELQVTAIFGHSTPLSTWNICELSLAAYTRKLYIATSINGNMDHQNQHIFFPLHSQL